MRIILLLAIAAFFSFSGCKPSYPKGQITESLRKVLKKEYNIAEMIANIVLKKKWGETRG